MITPASLQTQCYLIREPGHVQHRISGTQIGQRLGSTFYHHKYDYQNAAGHQLHTERPSRRAPGVVEVSFTQSNFGDCAVLPWQVNQICSMRLPANPGNDPDLVLTPTLNGCWVFLEKKSGGDIVFYHGNSQVAPPPNAQINPAAQASAVKKEVWKQYNKATKEHLGANVRFGALPKSAYRQPVSSERNRLRGGVETDQDIIYDCGTNVVGVYQNQRWEFYYQTWAEFTQMATLPQWVQTTKLAVKSGHKVLKCERFFP